MSSHPAKSAQRRPKVVQAGEGMRLNVQGIVFSYKAVGEDTESRYAFTEGIVPPSSRSTGTHPSSGRWGFYILEGEFEIECGGEVFKSASGHIRAATEGSSWPIPELVGHTGQGFVRAVF